MPIPRKKSPLDSRERKTLTHIFFRGNCAISKSINIFQELSVTLSLTHTHGIWFFPFLFADCHLVDFVISPTEREKVPFVFLPLEVGQSIYPSAQLILDSDQGDEDPICVVSSTDVLYKDGWHNLEKVYNEKNFASGQQDDLFYHHPVRLVQQPNQKPQLQVSLFYPSCLEW